MATARLLGDKIAVDATYREKALMRTIPGSRWQNVGQHWTLPLTWGSCITLRNTFLQSLEIDDDLIEWATRERERVDFVQGIRSSVHTGRFGYQEVGIEFLGRAGSAVLADEMGLGKSRQAIRAVASAGAYPCLIVCPNSLKRTWADEWGKWAPERSVAVVDGTAAQKNKTLAQDADVYIVNYDTIRSFSRLGAYGSIALTDKEKTPGALNRPWGAVIADEAHRAKDPRAKQTRALWAIGDSAERRIALSGTPVLNTPEDLWSIMHFVWPKDWPSRTAFIDRYCLAGFNPFGGLDVMGLKPERQAELFSILDPRFLRRTKAEVLTELPAKTYQTRYVTMGAKQAKAYDLMAKQMISSLDTGTLVATSPLVQLGRLVQMAAATPVMDEEGAVVALDAPSCKIDALLDILSEAPGEPLIVFAVSRKLVTACAEALDKAHVTYRLITGQVSSEDRAANVAAFQAGEVQVVLATVGAGGEGLTLTRASRAVFLQRPWSFAQYVQAQDRIHRVGQTAPVQIIDVITENTVEEHVLDVLDEKDEGLQAVCRDPQWLRNSLQRSPFVVYNRKKEDEWAEKKNPSNTAA